MGTMRYELSDAEWRILSGMLPNKPRGVARVDDRRVLNGIDCLLRIRADSLLHGATPGLLLGPKRTLSKR